MKITSDNFPREYYEKRKTIIIFKITKTYYLTEFSETLSKVSTIEVFRTL